MQPTLSTRLRPSQHTQQVHRRWRQFVSERRDVAPRAPLLFCSTDVSSCFDTLTQSRLFESLHSAMCVRGSDVSVQKRFIAIVPTPRRMTPRFKSDVCRRHDLAAAHAFFAERASTASTTLFIDHHLMKSLTSERALTLLRQHIFGNVLRVDGRCYVQQQGIPQGSLISSLLCSIHYGALDHVLLARFLARFCAMSMRAAPPAQDAAVGSVASALLRLVDDSLSVTTNATTHAGAPRRCPAALRVHRPSSTGTPPRRVSERYATRVPRVRLLHQRQQDTYALPRFGCSGDSGVKWGGQRCADELARGWCEPPLLRMVWLAHQRGELRGAA